MTIRNILSVALITALALGSCKKIEVKPKGLVAPEDALKTEKDLSNLLNSCYPSMAGGNFYGGRIALVSEYLGDQGDGSKLTGYDADIYNFKSSSDAGTSEVYTEPYVVIGRANSVIENLALASSDATKKNFEGQARFLRALAHFESVKLFAQPYGYKTDNSQPGVVVKTVSAEQLQRPRNTVKEVYDAIIADLKLAETLLPATNGVYPTSWAAKAILARVYFQMNDFANAYTYSNQVITSGVFSFDNQSTFGANRFGNPKSTEAIFYLVNEPTLGARFGGLRNDGNKDVSLGLPITAAAYQAGTSNTNDLRKAWYTNTNGVYGVSKYKNPSFILPVVHLTEMKLVRAESAAETNTNLAVGIGDINDITNRAYAGTYPALAANSDAATLKARVRAERKLEMIYEGGDRLQQIKRIGARGETSFSRTAPWNCNGLILQFPASEYNVNTNFQPNPTGGCN